MKKKKITVLLLLLTVTASLSGCGKKETEKEDLALLSPVETVIEVEPVLRRDLFDLTTKDAEYSPYQTELFFAENGVINRMNVKLTDTVKAGDILAEQSEEVFQSAVLQLTDSYQSFQKKHEEILSEIDQKLSAATSTDQKEWLRLQRQQEIETYELSEPLRKQLLQDAESKLGHNQIFAPFDGVITACLSNGTYVTSGQSVMAVADLSRGYVLTYTAITPAEIESYDEVYAIVNGEKKEIFYQEELQTEGSAHSYFLLPEGTEISFGDYVMLVFIKDVHKGVLSVPESAVYSDKNGDFVYRMVDGKRTKQSIITGYRNSFYVEVKEGLTEGESVYVKK